MRISAKPYGSLPDGQKVTRYTLTNRNGMIVETINYGGIITSLSAPDRSGKAADVVLGFDSLEGYIRHPFFCSLVGRNANRIELSEVPLNGVTYKVTSNCGKHQLHGGFNGFDKKVWDARVLSGEKDDRLELSCFSPDGEEGFPGNLETRVIYSLTDENELSIEYFAVSDRDTVVNLTNHAYFNLSGAASETVLSHELKINADFFLPTDSECIPTGEILSVKNTPFDFTQPRAIGDGIAQDENVQIRNRSGYDHNFVLRAFGERPEEAATLYDPASGRLMKVFTTSPGIQLYTGNYLFENGIGKGGKAMEKWQGVCLETQYYPNALKYRHFPSPVLKAGQTYHHVTVYQFGAR